MRTSDRILIGILLVYFAPGIIIAAVGMASFWAGVLGLPPPF